MSLVLNDLGHDRYQEYYAINNINDGFNTITKTAQLKLVKGDRVYVNFSGDFFMPLAAGQTVFEGQLIRQVFKLMIQCQPLIGLF